MAQKEMAEKNQNFVKDLFDKAEKDRRETERQNIMQKQQTVVAALNMIGNGAQTLIMNPKFMMRTAYFLMLCFGAFHFSKLAIQLTSTMILARFGKPSLVRETSKLHTKNPIFLPFMYGRKFIHQSMRRTEKNLLDGVILEKNLEE